MTVLSPIVQTWDGVNRRIYLKAGVSDFFPIEDLYHEYRTARRTDETLRQFDALMKAEGNVSKGAGAFTPRYVVLLDGAKIVPFDESLQINQLGDIITDDPDNDPLLYDISGLTTAKPIFIKPSEAETIQLNSLAIEHGSYGGVVTVDPTSQWSGVEYDVGTPRKPVNNMTDAHAIAEEVGIKVFLFLTSTTLNAVDYSDGHTFSGASPYVMLTVNPSANVTGCSFTNLSIQGEVDGINSIINCFVLNITNASGVFHNSAFGGTVHLAGEADMFNCYSRVEGGGYPVFDVGVNNVVARNHRGSLGIDNALTGHISSIGVEGGRFIAEATCTGGEIHVRSTPFEIVDNSGASCTVLDETEGVKLRKIFSANFHKRVWNKIAKTLTIFKDDKVTPQDVFDTNDDMSEIDPQ